MSEVRTLRVLTMACALSSILVPRTNAVELKSETLAAFDRYINATQRRLADDVFPRSRVRIASRLTEGCAYEFTRPRISL